MGKIWSFEKDTKDEFKSAYQFLYEYASDLKTDTGGIIEGLAIESISDFKEEIVYVLYLVVPELKNYSYRLIEVTQMNAVTPYPVNMKLYGKSGIVIKIDAIEQKEFEKELLGFISHSSTKAILTQLWKHLEIKKEIEH